MRVGLLFADRDLELDALPEPDPDLLTDLELERLFAAAAAGDERIAAVVRRVVPLAAVPDGQADAPVRVQAVLHRQAAVADVLAAPATVRELYRLASDAVEAERKVWGGAMRSAELVLRRSVEILDGLLRSTEAIRDVLSRDRPLLKSAALLGLADRLAAEADDAFLARARDALEQLRASTLVVTARLGPGNRPAGFVLHQLPGGRRDLRGRLGLAGARGLAVDVTLHDQNAMNALAELRGHAVADAAGAVAESAAHLLAFCRRLRDESAFLVGCANLDLALGDRGVARCMPEPTPGPERGMTATGIVDPCLSLTTTDAIVGNDLRTAGHPLTVVTGANGGGKSTLLRAVGVARLLQAAGVPVSAEALSATLPAGIVVHFPRPETGGEGSGRLDEELRRLDALVDRARRGTLVLLNEPLSTVNERDASTILAEFVRGLVAGGAEVWLVTHHHELAARLSVSPGVPVRFLRAERGDGTSRPFRVTEAPPLATSFGLDLWAGEVDGAQNERDAKDLASERA